jgi:hypothetical protein
MYICNVSATRERCCIGSRSNIQTDQEDEREGLEEVGIREGRDWRERVVFAKPKNIYI